ncbi:MAG: 1,4-dihydroxy-6-naphthoate synthase [Bacteroidota bacterium]
MKLSLGFSPCPNDTFIFYAMLHQKVDTEGLTFEVAMADVEELNQRAFAKTLDITKLSYHAFGYLIDDYVLLDAGSALGNNCGPILIAKSKLSMAALQTASIAIPGKYTTANFLFRLAYPDLPEGKEMLFSDIEAAILGESIDAGLIIHENRFTYSEKGLVKIRDMGEFWESTYNLPIPLGGIVASRKLPLEIQQRFNRVLGRSVAYAKANPLETLPYVSQFAQEMDVGVMQQHISLYVNDFTLNLGKKGKDAVDTLLRLAQEKDIIPKWNKNIFLPE